MSNLYENKFVIIKEAISKETALILFNYLQMKRHCWDTMTNSNFLGNRGDMGGFDPQVPDTWSCYSDIAMETLLEMLQPKIEREAGVKLLPMYTYSRLYKKGDILKKHKDRPSCEISTTLNLGGDPWSIFIEPDIEVGQIVEGWYKAGRTSGIEVKLNPGDMLLYLGAECEHWRNYFEGNICGQVFLHYANVETEYAKEYKYDARPHLGLPMEFMNKPVSRKGYLEE